jgi:hypothetical protein
LITLSLAIRSEDGKVRPSQLGKNIVLQTRELR